MGQNVGVRPGDEMLAGMNVAKELGVPAVMADRPIQITLRRAWAKNSLWGKCKLLASLITSAFSKDEMSEEEIENIKEKNEMDSMMAELADYMPVIKSVLIDERDQYLATKIWQAEGSNIVAVLGAGHLNGVEANLKRFAEEEAPADLEEISSLPKKGIGGKIAGWIIPVLIIALFLSGFIYGGRQLGSKMILSWVLCNGILSAFGTILAAGHPITILVAFISAPFTSLCPFIGVGFVTGIVQALVCKPKVRDIETLQDNVSLKGFYKNRILRVLLVFILSSLGSSIGTFVSGADIITKLFGAGQTALLAE